MKTNQLYKQENNLISHLSLMLLLLLTTTTLRAQTPANFSGTWAFDKTKSNPGQGGSFLDGDEILEITQNSTSITFAKTWIRQGSEDYKTTNKFNFDEEEKIVKEDFGTTKMNVKWSKDKRILTITTIMTTVSNGISKDYLVADSYKLSDNGGTLTIDSFSKNLATGERTITMVYNRKQK